MKLTCYILDDELHAIEIMRDYIVRTPGLLLLGFSTEPLGALAEITGPRPPDILFLDVDMPELNGLKFAELVDKRATTVIFTTAYREYAVEAFSQRAADYLVKPIFYERFLAGVQQVRQGRGGGTQPEDFFFVKTGTKGKLARVSVTDIRFISGADAYIEIHSKNEKLITYLSLAEVMKRLPEASFSRIHKSYIVRHALIRVIEPGQVRLDDDTCLPVGPAYRAAFLQKMNISSADNS